MVMNLLPQLSSVSVIMSSKTTVESIVAQLESIGAQLESDTKQLEQNAVELNTTKERLRESTERFKESSAYKTWESLTGQQRAKIKKIDSALTEEERVPLAQEVWRATRS